MSKRALREAINCIGWLSFIVFIYLSAKMLYAAAKSVYGLEGIYYAFVHGYPGSIGLTHQASIKPSDLMPKKGAVLIVVFSTWAISASFWILSMIFKRRSKHVNEHNGNSGDIHDK